MSEIKCEGGCNDFGGHSGEVVEVLVSGNGWKDTKFNYCQAAIEEDRRRGFTVTSSLPTHRSDPDDKDREIERLKGLIHGLFFKYYDDAFQEDMWQQFKTDNNL